MTMNTRIKSLIAFGLVIALVAVASDVQFIRRAGELIIGASTTDLIGFYGTAGTDQRSGANGTALTDSTGGSVSNATLADGLTTAALTENSGALGGTNDGDLPDLTATGATVAGTLTGTTDGTLANVADIALSTMDMYTDAAVNSAINAAILDLNLQLKELQEALNEVIADNVALRAAVREVATRANENRTDISTQNDSDAKTAELVNELRATLVEKGLHAGS